MFEISDETLALALEIVHGTYRTRKDLHTGSTTKTNRKYYKILTNSTVLLIRNLFLILGDRGKFNS